MMQHCPTSILRSSSSSKYENSFFSVMPIMLQKKKNYGTILVANIDFEVLEKCCRFHMGYLGNMSHILSSLFTKKGD